MATNPDKWFDHFLHSDRAAIDLGISALKTITLLNAGSLVALLAFIGQVWNKDQGRLTAEKIMRAGHPFIIGLEFGAAAFLLAYLYQSCITALRCFDLYNPQPRKIDLWPFSKPATKWIAVFFQIVMLILATLSFGTFVCGMNRIVYALSISS